MSPAADGTAAGRKSYVPDDPMSYKTPQVRQPVRYGSKKGTHLAPPASEPLEREGLNSPPSGGQAPIPRSDCDPKDAPVHHDIVPAHLRIVPVRIVAHRALIVPASALDVVPTPKVVTPAPEFVVPAPEFVVPAPKHVIPNPALPLQYGVAIARLRLDAGPSHAKHNRAYDDHIDELDEKLAADEASIASIKKEMSKFRAVAGEVQSLKKELSDVKAMRSELTEVRTALADIVSMLKSGTHLDTLNLATDKGALQPIVSASAPAPSDLEPEGSTSKKKKKKKTSKDVLGIEYTKDQLKLSTTHVRKTLYRMMGIASAGEIQPPVQNTDGTYQWWVKNDTGQPKLRPKFAPSLTAPNTDPKTGWTQDFVEHCQDCAHMEAGKDFLSTIPGDTFIQILETQLWQYLWTVWKDIQSGKRESKVAQDLARGRDNARNEFKGISRAKAREGTVVGGDKYKFLEHRGWQSPEHSDAENPNRKCIDEPAYRSEKVNQLNDVLRLRYRRIVGDKASPATRTDVVWFKTNELELPNLGEDIAHPAWTINQDWAQNNPEAYEEVRYLIDEDDAEPPDFSELLRKYPPLPRKYVDWRPIPANGVRSTHSQSASLVVSGPVLPDPGALHIRLAPTPGGLPQPSGGRFNMDGNAVAEVSEGASSRGWEFEDGGQRAPTLLQSEPNNPYPAPPGSHSFAYNHSSQSQPAAAHGYPIFYPPGAQPSQSRPYLPAPHTHYAFPSSQAQVPGHPPIFNFRAAKASHSVSQPQQTQYYSSHAGLAVVSQSGQEQSWQPARDQQAPIGQTPSQQEPANHPALPAPEQLNMRTNAPALAPLPIELPPSIQGLSAPSPNAQTMAQNTPWASTPSAPSEPGVTQPTTAKPMPTEPILEVTFLTQAPIEPVCALLQAAEPSNPTCTLSQAQSDVQGTKAASKSTRLRPNANLHTAQAPTRTSSRKRGVQQEVPSTSTAKGSRGPLGGKRGRKKAAK